MNQRTSEQSKERAVRLSAVVSPTANHKSLASQSTAGSTDFCSHGLSATKSSCCSVLRAELDKSLQIIKAQSESINTLQHLLKDNQQRLNSLSLKLVQPTLSASCSINLRLNDLEIKINKLNKILGTVPSRALTKLFDDSIAILKANLLRRLTKSISTIFDICDNMLTNYQPTQQESGLYSDKILRASRSVKVLTLTGQPCQYKFGTCLQKQQRIDSLSSRSSISQLRSASPKPRLMLQKHDDYTVRTRQKNQSKLVPLQQCQYRA